MRKNFIRLLQLAAAYKWWMLLAAGMGFFTIASSIGLLMASAFIIAKAALHPSIAALSVAIVGVRFFGIARGIFRYLERLISHEVTFRLLAKFRVWFYQALEPLAPARLMSFRSGDILSRVIADIESLEHFYVRVIAPPLVALLISLLMWFLFSIFSWIFSLILVAMLMLSGLGIPYLIHLASRAAGKQLVTLRSELSVMAIDGIQGLADLVAFGAVQTHHQTFEKINKKFLRLQRRMEMITGLHESATTLFMNLTVFLILFMAIPKVSTFLLDGVYLSVLVMGTMACFEAIMPLPLAAQYLEHTMKAAERLFEITDARPPIIEPRHPRTIPRRPSLAFNNVSFSYHQNSQYALRGVTFQVDEGENIAIVGPSGSGKTTIVNLLLRFWEVDEGEILLGDVPYHLLLQEDIRQQFAIVSQDTFLFTGSFKENLLLANPHATQDELIHACRLAQLHDFIANLPDGYETQIGEQGVRLSGGERQRLAIARAILKNPKIMIYDEPTANLDAITERRILDTIWQLGEAKTTLLITHRLISLERADRILVMRNGQIVETGKHAILLQKKNLYYRMWKIQQEFIRAY